MPLATLEEVRDACNIAAADTSKDTWLTQAIDAATTVIENLTGTIETRTVTWTGNGGTRSVLLPDAIVSVTSVTVDGVPITDYTASPNGVVYTGTGIAAGMMPFPVGIANVVIVYVAGDDAIIPAATMACTELVRIWYQNGQQGSRPAFGGAATETAPAGGYPVPSRVLAILRPLIDGRESRQMPGFG